MTYTQPFFPLLLFLTFASAVRLWRKPRRAGWLLVCFTALVLFAWPPAASTAAGLLERRYSDHLPPTAGVEAIVVLSSSVIPPAPPLPIQIPDADTSLRCRYAAWLYSNGAAIPLLVSGRGSGAGVPYSRTMSETLQQEGVPGAMIWVEDQSHSTYENALYSAAILRSKSIRTILLVTEAFHMRRAEACFRKQGITVVPAPCGVRSRSPGNFDDLLPGWEAISWNEATLHEVAGLGWYWIRGWI